MDRTNMVLIAFVISLLALVVTVLVGDVSTDRSDVVKALIALSVALGGAVAGAQIPTGRSR